jgi:molybdopterin-guanine dinucleotide biosynthesis protein A
MAREPRDYDALVPRLSGRSRQGESGLVYQTLHAIYGKGALPAIDACLAEGKRQVVSFFPDVRVRALEQGVVERWDPELRSFFNANTPALLAVARALVAGKEPETAELRLAYRTETAVTPDKRRT